MNAITAVRRAAARHGIVLTEEAARDIADAALGAYDDTTYVSAPVAAEMWDQPSFRAHLRADMLRKLMTLVIEKEAVPIELPTVTTRVVPEQLFVYAPGMIEVTVTVRVRKPQAAPATV